MSKFSKYPFGNAYCYQEFPCLITDACLNTSRFPRAIPVKSRRSSSPTASPTLISTLLRPSPSLSHDVSQPRNLPCTRVLRISTPRAISGIRKLLARNSIGVHSNSRIPYPLPVHTPMHTRSCVAPSSCTKDQCRVQVSRDDFTIISADICEQIRVLLRSCGGRQGRIDEGRNFEFGQGIRAMLEFCLRFEECATRFLI